METKVTLLEAIEVFKPDLIPVLEEKLSDLLETEMRLQALLELKVKAAQSYFKGAQAIYWVKVKSYRTAQFLAKIQTEIARISTALSLARGNNTDWEVKFERVKVLPIEDLYKGSLRKFGNKFVGLCPFHQERTPSFTIYTSNNSFYCFGCHTGGDSVDFIKLAEKKDFKEVVQAYG